MCVQQYLQRPEHGFWTEVSDCCELPDWGSENLKLDPLQCALATGPSFQPLFTNLFREEFNCVALDGPELRDLPALPFKCWGLKCVPLFLA